MFEVYLEHSAERDLKRLPAQHFQRIISSIKALPKNPRPSGCRKISGTQRDWRIRVGDYRILYEINERSKTVKIMRIRHRREVYR